MNEREYPIKHASTTVEVLLIIYFVEGRSARKLRSMLLGLAMRFEKITTCSVTEMDISRE